MCRGFEAKLLKYIGLLKGAAQAHIPQYLCSGSLVFLLKQFLTQTTQVCWRFYVYLVVMFAGALREFDDDVIA